MRTDVEHDRNTCVMCRLDDEAGTTPASRFEHAVFFGIAILGCACWVAGGWWLIGTILD